MKKRKIIGTPERPRLSVYRSLGHIYAQVIDDQAGKTLMAASSLKLKKGKKVEIAEAVGVQIAKLALDKGIKKVVFDRGEFLYHGRIKKLADAARKEGLEF